MGPYSGMVAPSSCVATRAMEVFSLSHEIAKCTDEGFQHVAYLSLGYIIQGFSSLFTLLCCGIALQFWNRGFVRWPSVRITCVETVNRYLCRASKH